MIVGKENPRSIQGSASLTANAFVHDQPHLDTAVLLASFSSMLFATLFVVPSPTGERMRRNGILVTCCKYCTTASARFCSVLDSSGIAASIRVPRDLNHVSLRDESFLRKIVKFLLRVIAKRRLVDREIRGNQVLGVVVIQANIRSCNSATPALAWLASIWACWTSGSFLCWASNSLCLAFSGADCEWPWLS